MTAPIKAILTGHSKGLGLALCENLLGRHIPVMGLSRGTADQLPAALAPLCVQVKIDLAECGALASWLATPLLGDFLQECSQVLLINNAGVVQPVGALYDQDPVDIGRAVSLNVAAPLTLAAAVVQAAPDLDTRILHISSGAGSSAYPGWSVYCATKAALDHHARAVALDGRPRVRICSLAPGIIDTGMQAAIRATPASRFPLRQRFVELERTGQLSSPADCAQGIVSYLLDERFGHQPVDDLRSQG